MKYVQINNTYVYMYSHILVISTCMRITGSTVSCMYMYSVLKNLVQNGLLVVGLVH